MDQAAARLANMRRARLLEADVDHADGDPVSTARDASSLRPGARLDRDEAELCCEYDDLVESSDCRKLCRFWSTEGDVNAVHRELVAASVA